MRNRSVRCEMGGKWRKRFAPPYANGLFVCKLVCANDGRCGGGRAPKRTRNETHWRLEMSICSWLRPNSAPALS